MESRRHGFVLWTGLIVWLWSVATLGADLSSYRRYLREAQNSLDLMRSPLGLIRDKVWVVPKATGYQLRTLNANTSPTNLALDLLVQLGRDNATRRCQPILRALDALPVHTDSGLFFNRYDSETGHVVDRDLSSIDNLHLALALWTAAHELPAGSGRTLAAKLFDRMDFSAFIQPHTGFVGGLLKWKGSERWGLEPWDYHYLGSEARSLYSVGRALGLFRKIPDNRWARLNVLQTELTEWHEGTLSRPLLRLWDGGTFQLLLPQILIGESRYSRGLSELFESYARFVLDGARARKLPLPPAFSACNFGVDFQSLFGWMPWYNGQVGSPELVSSHNVDFKRPVARDRWDLVVTPHAVFLAATQAPGDFLPYLSRMESLHSGDDWLHRAGLGWMDGYVMRGEYRNRVVPVILSLDQAMLELAIEWILKGDTASAHALRADASVSTRLSIFYDGWERLLGTRLQQFSLGVSAPELAIGAFKPQAPADGPE